MEGGQFSSAIWGHFTTANDTSRSVIINTPEIELLQRQIDLLQSSMAPETPRDAVDKWAKGVKYRNGSEQFAVLSPGLKEKSLAEYEECGWVTGVSSPWVEKYEIKATSMGEKTCEYEVKFYLMTSTGDAGSYLSKLVVSKYDQIWYISKVDNIF